MDDRPEGPQILEASSNTSVSGGVRSRNRLRTASDVDMRSTVNGLLASSIGKSLVSVDLPDSASPCAST